MNIKEVTMYEAIDAMLIGLETIPNGSFKIDMTTFGNIDNNVCYGCAVGNTTYWKRKRQWRYHCDRRGGGDGFGVDCW